ncbi:hypothetical protein BOX15_Mlig031789g1, partial [Macrostomum lignano]
PTSIKSLHKLSYQYRLCSIIFEILKDLTYTNHNRMIESLVSQLTQSNDLMKSHLRADTDEIQLKSEERFEFERRLRLKDMQLEEQSRTLLTLEARISSLEAEIEKQKQKYRSLSQQRDEALELVEQLRQRLDMDDGNANGGSVDPGSNALVSQSTSDDETREVESLRQQLLESNKKRDDVIKAAEQMRQRLEEELGKSATAHTELEQLKLEHAKLRNDYSGMERTMTEMLTREHELNTQLTEAQGKLRQAEEAIGWFKQELPRKDGEIANLTDEVHTLRERVNTLLENLAGQEQLNNYQSGNDLLNKHRSMRPPGGGGNL